MRTASGQKTTREGAPSGPMDAVPVEPPARSEIAEIERRLIRERLEVARRRMDWLHYLRSVDPTDPETQRGYEAALEWLRRCIHDADARGCL